MINKLLYNLGDFVLLILCKFISLIRLKDPLLSMLAILNIPLLATAQNFSFCKNFNKKFLI
jgi:hypothetical protein